ncbi:glucose-1-phosphate thymidylyltransferase [Haloprofundus marisrubri]|uniref:Glucose-1-phosphate thymidylyltransferase n=1 Tax=Haloprofundus marisrubri TaxID=1514971 RepID=A0A0W1R7A6_9EURY|nr:NDP-sugar synthase [Haloprofundus marisrubri]KTG08999.1 glucose-1-phosphate thymidylyltransferase [Haloprofundus marisrubri]
MQAIVLAGGYATRLWPLTKDRPKMLLPVGETTVIDELLSDLENDDRISDVFVSTNERFAPDFETHLEESEFEKPRLSVEETVEEDEKFGVVGALAQLINREGLEDNDEDLVVVAGDNLFSFDLDEFIDHFEEQSTPSLAAYDVGSKEKAKAYGLVELDDGEVVNFQEKPENPNSTLVSLACYAFPSEVLSQFDEYLSSDNNPDEPGWFLQWLQSRQTVRAFTFSGAWFDIGSADGYLEAIDWALAGEPLIADDATVENSRLEGSVQVLPGATVSDSTLARSVVFPNSQVTNASVDDTVIDSEATVENIDLSESVIGSYTTVAQDAEDEAESAEEATEVVQN